MSTHTCETLLKQPLDIHVGDIVVGKTGARNASLGSGPELEPIRIALSKSPSLSTPFVPTAFDGGDRVSLDIRGPTELQEVIDKIDRTIKAYVIKHKAKYWKKAPSDTELESYYTPLLRRPDNDKYSPTIRTKMTLGDSPSAKFWTHKKAPLSHNNIDWRNSEFAVQIRLKSVWFQSNKSFGCCAEVEHVMVRQSDSSCPFEGDKSDDES